MSELFKLSAKAWEVYARREQCDYKLWGADDVDAIMQQEAPEWVLEFYKVSGCLCNGLMWLVSLFCTIAAAFMPPWTRSPTLTVFQRIPWVCARCWLGRRRVRMCKKPEWEIEVVVAEEGNTALLQILQDMKVAFAEKEHNELVP